MAKDPAFLFYPGDWNLGTMHLTLLEKGCYMELLILQFAKGKFTEAQAKHMLNGSFDLAWANIKEKFKTDGNFYWNERLEREKHKRQKFTESRRINALSAKKKENDTKAYAKHMGKHMENKNENINTNLVCYNVEEYISKNQQVFESICMATSKKIDDAKSELRMYHLWLEKNERYPMGNKAVIAGFESWLLNEKRFKNKYDGANKSTTGVNRFTAGANQLLERGKAKYAAATGKKSD